MAHRTAPLFNLELARREVGRAPAAVPEPLRVALHTGKVQVDYGALFETGAEPGRLFVTVILPRGET